MKRWIVCVPILFCLNFVGCGGNGAIQLPTDQLTEEQKAQLKKDDEKVADEESQGSVNKKKKK